MLMIMDSIERDIKQLLLTSPRMRAQWKTIRNGIYKNHQKDYTSLSSFGVILDRALKRLLKSGDVKKDYGEKRKVFYHIPKKRRALVNEQIQREHVHQAFDDLWNSLTPEQKKGTVTSLTNYSFLMNKLIQKSLGEFAGSIDELLSIYTGQLENPSENTLKNYSLSQRKEFLSELHDLRSECDKLKQKKDSPKDQDFGKEFSINLKLAQEFTKTVVEPKYNGEWNSAIIDLMKKAIEQEKKKLE
jgi:hypothetical protein